MKTKTKKKLVRLLRTFMIVFAILNLIGIISGFGIQSYAEENDSKGFNVSSILANGALGGLSFIMGGLPLIILNVLKLVIILIGLILQVIISGAYSSLEGSLNWAGLKDIIFAGSTNASKFLDVNFFDLNLEAGALLTFRTAIAKWYYILRLIAAAILLVILIYVGIKMAISTIASEQAKYKQMLVDWVASLALLFLLHYIIMFAITVNGALVEALSQMCDDTTGDMMSSIVGMMFWIGIEGIFAAIVYVFFVGEIFSFFLLYMKRMITVGFLIMIAPLITITYAIDKMGDGKAQALNAWLKELVYNILIQPFHCVIFMAFFDAIATIIKNDKFSIGAYIFAILIMKFMKKAEEILRKIFHFEASSMSSLSESGQNIANATGKFVGVGMAAGGALANFKAAGGFKAAKQNWQQFKENRAINSGAKKLVKDTYKKVHNGSTEGFREYKKKDHYQDKLEWAKKITAANMKKEADKKAIERRDNQINKNREKYDKKHGAGAYDAMIDKKAEKAYDQEHGAGTYQLLKNVASQKTRKGQPTPSAIKAQNKLNEAQMQAHNKVIEDGGVGVKRTLKNGWDKTGGRAFTSMRKFADSDYGKLVGAAAKDSTKIAAAIGMGAFALGATGEVNDAISLGQVGYGAAKGFLQNSTKTLTKDSAEKVEQLAALQGVDASDSEALQKLLAGIKAEKNAGALDTKSISNQLEKLEEKIKSLFGDRATGSLESSLFTNAIQAAVAKGQINPAEIEKLIEEQFSKMDDDDKVDIKLEASKYAQIILKAGVATNETTLENAGIDVDEHDAKVVDRVTKRN